MAYNNRRGKHCRISAEDIDYKNPWVLEACIAETGRIVPSRVTGNLHQRKMTREIKIARELGLLPFCDTHE